jgi:cytosine/adenosine deaminase-related metal-dependent hydrolase
MGKRADVMISTLQRPLLCLKLMPVHHWVYKCSGVDVKTVIMDGKIVMENRQS